MPDVIKLKNGWNAEIYTVWDFTEDVVTQWDYLSANYGDAGFFLSYGWFNSWWSAFGKNEKPFVAVLKKDGETKAIFPLCTDGQNLKSMTNSHTCHYDFIVDASDREGALYAFITLLQHINGNGTIDVNYIPSSSVNVILFAKLLNANRVPFHLIKNPRAPWMNISGSWEEYFRSLPKGLRETIKNCGNRAAKQGGLRLETVNHADGLDEYLTKVFDVEFNSWKGQEGTAIKCQKEVEYFYRSFAHHAIDQGKLILHILTLEGTPIAADYCIKSGRTVFLMKTGYNQKFASLSPGVLLQSEIFKDLFSMHVVSVYNFLGSCDQWKMRWTPQSEEYSHINIYPKSLRGWVDYSVQYGWKNLLKRSSMIRYAKDWLDK